MYLEVGIFSRERWTRSLDTKSLGNDGNAMPCNSNDRKRGADPPKNASGRTRGRPLIRTKMKMCQGYKWLEHHRNESSQCASTRIGEPNMGDAIMAFQCCNDILKFFPLVIIYHWHTTSPVVAHQPKRIAYGDREGRPNIQ